MTGPARDEELPALVVTITADASRFQAAMEQLMATWAALPARVRHALWAIKHGGRHRSRLVTRRKQRRNW